MTISTIESLKIALIPGQFETLNKQGFIYENVDMQEVSEDLKCSRDALYMTMGLIALGALMALGEALSDEPHTEKLHVAGTAIASGLIISIRPINDLYNTISRFRENLIKH